MKKLNRILLAGLCALTVSTSAFARGMQPVANYENQSIEAPGGKTLTEEQVKNAIVTAVTGRGWTVDNTEARRIVASHSRGSHAATVEIIYAAGSYSIRYLSSERLRYSDGGGAPTIHPVYNSWARNLKLSIDSALRSF